MNPNDMYVAGIILLIGAVVFLLIAVFDDFEPMAVLFALVFGVFGAFFIWGPPSNVQSHKLTGVVQYASDNGKQLVVDNVTINCKGADCNSIELGDYITLRCAVNQDEASLADFVCTYIQSGAVAPTK